MCADSNYKKTASPQSSTEVSSLQVNRLKNKEALERRLQCRRSVKELISQGILINPSISNPDKVRQLQRAKLSDLLKHKIEKRPDRQSLINRRIIRDDKPGTSPYILEQCHNLEKNSLRNSLKSKLNARPGSLELIEKGVLQVDPGVDSLVRTGSIQYPRVEPVPPSNESSLLNPLLMACGKSLNPSFTPIIPKPALAKVKTASTGNRQSFSNSSSSRSMKDETVVYKLGSLVFHNYCPKSSQLASPNLPTNSSFQQRQKAREAQQAEMLRLQATADVPHLVGHDLDLNASEHAESSQNALDNASFSGSSPFSQYNFSDIPTHSVLSPEMAAHALGTNASSFSPSEYSEPSPSSVSLLSPYTPPYSDSTSGLKSLEHLSCVRLRAECQERNLPRSGTKAALIRQLEPFREEILTKYFRSSKNRNPKDNISTTVEYRVLCSQSENGHSSTSHSSTAPPLWPTSFQATSALSDSIPVEIHTICPCASVCVNPTSSAGLDLPSGLRHSNSDSYIIDVSHASAVSLLNPTTVHGNMCSFSSAVLPVSAASQTAVLLTHPHSVVSGSTCARVSASDSSGPPSGAIYFASNLLSFTQATALSCSSPVRSNPPTFDIAQSDTNNVQSVRVYQPLGATLLGCPHPNPPLRSLSSSTPPGPSSSDPSVSAPSDISQPTGESIASLSEASGLPPSLAQIEDVWLQVRKLRRQIAKDQITEPSGNDRSDAWDNVHAAQRLRLKQEHDRLVVLCRLLVIDRLDALDDLMDSGMDSSSSDSAIQTGYSVASQWQLERNLMLSYLRKLGGTALVDRVSSPTDHYRRSSSPIIHTQLPAFSGNPVGGILTSRHSSRSHATSSSSHLPQSGQAMDITDLSRPVLSPTINQAFSWSDGLQQASSFHARPADNGNDARLPSLGNTSEPPASPLNTDALFDLWHSLLKDSPSPAKEGSPPATRQPTPDCPTSVGSDHLNFHFTGSQPSASFNAVSIVAPNVTLQSTDSHFSSPSGGNAVTMDSSQLTGMVNFPRDLHTQVSSSSAFPGYQQHYGTVYYPQPFPYSFTGSESHASNTVQNKSIPLPSAGTQWASNVSRNPHASSNIPAEQMADALFSSLDAVNFPEMMDTSETQRDYCTVPTSWPTSC